MEYKVALAKFQAQRSKAAKRRIEWKLTFFEWCEFWGEQDIARRGPGPNDLCMCRHQDQGAYELGNIYKGTNAENARTHGSLIRKRHGEATKRTIFNAEMLAPTREARALDIDLGMTEDDKEMLRMFQPRRSIGL